MTNETRKKLLFELKLAFNGADHFTAILLRLLLKADYDNQEKLALGFPDEVEIVRDWRLGKIDQDEVA